MNSTNIYKSRYANIDEVYSIEFQKINKKINEYNVIYKLADHYDLNIKRYPWSISLMSRPQYYGSRMWEYPWAIIESNVKKGMKCADIGCGESPFTIYLKEIGCDVTGYDPDYGTPPGWYCHGVSFEYVKRTNLNVINSKIQNIKAADNVYDRVFCISVIEHIEYIEDQIKGMREIARIMKPEALALITVDVNMMQKIVNPMRLAWESGLTFEGLVDITMPTKRLGVYCDGNQPADVYGMVLKKPSGTCNIKYDSFDNNINAIDAVKYRDRYESYIDGYDYLKRYKGLEPYFYDLIKASENKGNKWYFLIKMIIKCMLNKYPEIKRNE